MTNPDPNCPCCKDERLRALSERVVKLDAEAQHYRQRYRDTHAQLDAAKSEAKVLEERIREDNAACICPCPEDDHEWYEGQPCCSNDCACILVCNAARQFVDDLRAQLSKAESERESYRLEEKSMRELAKRLQEEARQAICSYCGASFAKDDSGSILGHITACPRRTDAYERQLRDTEAQLAKCREALDAAAKSLDSIWAGRAELSPEDTSDARWQVRQYAKSRADVAHAALAPEPHPRITAEDIEGQRAADERIGQIEKRLDERREARRKRYAEPQAEPAKCADHQPGSVFGCSACTAWLVWHGQRGASRDGLMPAADVSKKAGDGEHAPDCALALPIFGDVRCTCGAEPAEKEG